MPLLSRGVEMQETHVELSPVAAPSLPPILRKANLTVQNWPLNTKIKEKEKN